MKELCYDVILYAPIGERAGEIILLCDRGKVNGRLILLEQTTELEGTVDGEGNLEIEGEIITVMRKKSYSARGRISDYDIYLTLVTKNNSYDLVGQRKK